LSCHDLRVAAAPRLSENLFDGASSGPLWEVAAINPLTAYAGQHQMIAMNQRNAECWTLGHSQLPGSLLRLSEGQDAAGKTET